MDAGRFGESCLSSLQFNKMLNVSAAEYQQLKIKIEISYQLCRMCSSTTL